MGFEYLDFFEMKVFVTIHFNIAGKKEKLEELRNYSSIRGRNF